MHGGLPLAKRLPRELELAFWNATHGKLQDVHPKRFRKLADVAFGRTRETEQAVFAGRPRKHVDHHTCHAASAYYQSGFDEAEVMTCDGVGDTFTALAVPAAEHAAPLVVVGALIEEPVDVLGVDMAEVT